MFNIVIVVVAADVLVDIEKKRKMFAKSAGRQTCFSLRPTSGPVPICLHVCPSKKRLLRKKTL